MHQADFNYYSDLAVVKVNDDEPDVDQLIRKRIRYEEDSLPTIYGSK